MTILIPHLGKLAPPKPDDELQRLSELHAMRIMDTAAEERFDQYTQLLATVLDMPMAAVSLVDEHRQWFKSRFGIPVAETSRDFSFCGHALLEDEMLVIPDTLEDARFRDNPLVVGEPKIRSYAGGVVRGPSGKAIGTCCVLDLRPRELSPHELSVLRQITQMVQAELALARRSGDPADKTRAPSVHTFAGMPVEAMFMARLRQAVDAAAARSERLLLALVRVDRFDALDAALGAIGVNYLMGELAGRITEITGPSGLIGQAREDKIAVAVPLAPGELPESVLERLIGSARDPIDLVEHSVPLRLSIGASVYPHDAPHPDALMKRARTALWSIPMSDHSGFRLYERDLSNRASSQFRIETAMKRGLANGEFQLVFQPKVDIKRQRLAGAEALLRWNSESLGHVSPATFIPVAEECGLIGELGAWVLERSCRQLAEWTQTGVGCPEIAVNVTSYQLRRPDFREVVADYLAANGIAGHRLNLELTESSLVDDVVGAVAIMHELRELGVMISIDDFGTGFSSLSYLRRMPIQTLKVDRSFISNLADDEDDRKLVRSIVSMAHDLELEVVAEGVETRAQLGYLASIDCDLVQGFLFSSPLPADRFAAFARAWETRGAATGKGPVVEEQGRHRRWLGR